MSDLLLLLLRENRIQRSVPLRGLPWTVGSHIACDLQLEGLAELHARLTVGPTGQPHLRTMDKAISLEVDDGVQVTLGAWTLAFQAPTESGSARGGLLERMLEMMPRVWTGEDPEGDLTMLVETLLSGFDATWGAVLGYDDAGEPRVMCDAGERSSGDAEGPLSRTLLKRLEDSERPVLAGDLRDDSGNSRIGSIPADVRSVIASPLFRDGKRVGLVYLESPVTRRTYTQEERQLLARVCEFAAQHLDQAQRARDLRARSERLGELYRQEVQREHGLGQLIGSSPAMQEVIKQIRQVAGTPTTVLVLGESGTGKELVASAIHQLSPRDEEAFVAVNCLALPADLVESELFGHVKGAFTGAVKARLGRFEMAHRGTLFLDEIGEIPLSLQGKLLRVLQERVVQRLGEGKERKVDVRLVAATNADLGTQIAAGTFREDLFYRLSVFVIQLPPLRQRAGDVSQLARYFLDLLNARSRKQIQGFEPEALDMLEAHAWPGNVRELRNALEQAFLRETSEVITAESLSLGRGPRARVAGPAVAYPDDLEVARSMWEKAHIERVLREEAGRMSVSAKRLGITRSYLYKRCTTYGIDAGEFRR